MARQPLLNNETRLIDRFGLLTMVTAATIVMLMLVNIDPNLYDSLQRWESWVASALAGATLLLALRASGLNRRWQRIADILVIVVVVALGLITLLQEFIPSLESTAGPAPLAVVALAVLAPVAVIARLVRHREVTRGTLQGAISGYLLLALTYFYLFLAVERLSDERFFAVEVPTQSFMYFSLVTITTTGYGDLTAQSDLGRLVATSEAVIGQIYLVTFVALIVGLLVSSRRSFRLSGDPDASQSPSDPST